MKPVYKALFCGARDWEDPVPIRREIAALKLFCKREGFELVIIEGEAPGADTLSRVTAEISDVHVCRVAALWQTRHRSAGPQRNGIMLALDPDEVVAFHKNITKSRGTKNMIKQAQDKGIRTTVHKR
jgi:hypothetical protein